MLIKNFKSKNWFAGIVMGVNLFVIGCVFAGNSVVVYAEDKAIILQKEEGAVETSINTEEVGPLKRLEIFERILADGEKNGFSTEHIKWLRFELGLINKHFDKHFFDLTMINEETLSSIKRNDIRESVYREVVKGGDIENHFVAWDEKEGVSRNKVWIIDMGATMKASSISSQSVFVLGPDGLPLSSVQVELSEDKTKVVMKNENLYDADTRYEIRISPLVKSNNGKHLEKGLLVPFETVGVHPAKFKIEDLLNRVQEISSKVSILKNTPEQKEEDGPKPLVFENLLQKLFDPNKT